MKQSTAQMTQDSKNTRKMTKADLAYEIRRIDGGMPYLMLMMLTKAELVEKYNALKSK